MVTHDYKALQRIADHVLVLNHHSLQLDEVDREKWSDIPKILGNPPEADADIEHGSTPVIRRIGSAALSAMAESGQSVEGNVAAAVGSIAVVDKFSLGAEANVALSEAGIGLVGVCVYRDRRNDHWLCGAGFHLSLLAVSSVFGAVADREPAECHWLFAVSFSCSDSVHDSHCSSIRSRCGG